jgi:hypothetical protein
MTVYNPYNFTSFYQNFIVDTFLYNNVYSNVIMKLTFAILGIIAAVGLMVSIVAPSAFAVTQSNIQSSELSSSLSQTGINIAFPQTSVLGNSQSNVQTDCVFFSFGCR